MGCLTPGGKRDQHCSRLREVGMLDGKQHMKLCVKGDADQRLEGGSCMTCALPDCCSTDIHAPAPHWPCTGPWLPWYTCFPLPTSCTDPFHSAQLRPGFNATPCPCTVQSAPQGPPGSRGLATPPALSADIDTVCLLLTATLNPIEIRPSFSNFQPFFCVVCYFIVLGSVVLVYQRHHGWEG